MALLQFRQHEGAAGEIAERALGRRFVKAGELGDELHLHGRGEMGERGEHFGLVRGEGVQQVAEDELQRVVLRRGAAQEVQRGGDFGATSETKLARDPADEQGIAAGLLVEGAALGIAGLADRGKSRPSSAMRAQAASQSSRSSRTTTALASARRRLVTMALEPRGRRLRNAKSWSRSGSGTFSRLSSTSSTSASRRARRMARAVHFGRFRSLRLPKLARDGIEHLEIGGHYEVAERPLAIGCKLALLRRKKDDAAKAPARDRLGMCQRL